MESTSAGTKVEEKAQGQPAQRFVVGIQYRRAGKIYSFLTGDEGLVRGDTVVVESDQGASIGFVILPPQSILENDLPKGIKKVLRRASPEEQAGLAAQCERELEIFEIFAGKVAEHNLPMKPLTAELREGEKKAVLTFFAEDRVDFRMLVKDLATSLHMRIEMHQIGARDEVKYRGGIGSCGFLTCCSQHLRQFQSISIQMAKNQGLTPNPAKLTGICGKLKCCLAYENSLYAELRQRMPRVGMLVKVPQGNGKVTGLDILNEMCIVRLDDGGEVKVPLRDVSPQTQKQGLRPEGLRPEGSAVAEVEDDTPLETSLNGEKKTKRPENKDGRKRRGERDRRRGK